MDRGQEYVGRDSLATYRNRGNRIIVDVFVTEILVPCDGEIVEITCCFSRLRHNLTYCRPSLSFGHLRYSWAFLGILEGFLIYTFSLKSILPISCNVI